MKTHALRVGLFFAGLYVLCLFWRLTMTDPAVMNFHLLSLKTLFPGFQGYDALSILWGGVLSFAYGFAGSWVFHSFHNECCVPVKDLKKDSPVKDMSAFVLPAAILIVGLALGMALSAINGSPTQGYAKESASMMKNNGSMMMQMGQMMMGGGGMMSDRGQKYGDTEMMQRGKEMMDSGQSAHGHGSTMKERGESMMQMMQ